MRSFIVFLTIVGAAIADVSELSAQSGITTILGKDGYEYPAPDTRIDIEVSVPEEVPEEVVTEEAPAPLNVDDLFGGPPACLNGGPLPYCCENGANNLECDLSVEDSPTVEYLPPDSEV